MINYRVVAVHDNAIEVWDGVSQIDTSTIGLGPATMTIPIERSSKFEIGDIVDLVVVLRERPEKT